MKIAFYSPLKSPHHPVPSGDRLMARLLIAALERAGHAVVVASEMRSFSPSPPDEGDDALGSVAESEIARVSALWQAEGGPDAWFCYHPYYKAPDLLGPALSARFGLAYITAEASYSARRNVGGWGSSQAQLLDNVRRAAVNICMTRRDRDGLSTAAPDGRFAMLPPFIDPAPFLTREPEPEPGHLICVAMMRPGDKMKSYEMLAAALQRLEDLPWRLSVVGEGSEAGTVKALFADFAQGRVEWHGERTADEIADLLSRAALYVWPGCGEAYGLAYLEAQAAGVPVVAQAVAGVPEVVRHGETGLLTPTGDVASYAGAIRRLLDQEADRAALAKAARAFAGQERSVDKAAGQLKTIFATYLEGAR